MESEERPSKIRKITNNVDSQEAVDIDSASEQQNGNEHSNAEAGLIMRTMCPGLWQRSHAILEMN